MRTPGANGAGSVAPDDLSRFEGEGGPETPVPTKKLIDVPLENAVWRRPHWAAYQADQENIMP
jgi:hypothetical protein